MFYFYKIYEPKSLDHAYPSNLSKEGWDGLSQIAECGGKWILWNYPSTAYTVCASSFYYVMAWTSLLRHSYIPNIVGCLG